MAYTGMKSRKSRVRRGGLPTKKQLGNDENATYIRLLAIGCATRKGKTAPNSEQVRSEEQIRQINRNDQKSSWWKKVRNLK